MSSTKAPVEASASRRDRTALWITYVNIVLYALCYQLQNPVEPFLVNSLSEKHDAATVGQTYGRLRSFFSAVQTVGSPLVGILLDRIGIRTTSAIVFLSSAASYALLARATEMPLLFASKIPTALQHAFLVAQATAATSTGGDPAARAQALGRMTTAYTIGATVGPALGGYLADGMGDLYLGARLAVFGSMISVILSIMFLQDGDGNSSTTDGKKSGAEVSQKDKRSFLAELRRSAEIAGRHHIWPLLLVKVVSGTASSMHSTALPLVLTQRLNFNPSQLGVSMSTAMFTIAGFGAIGMAPLTARFGTWNLAEHGLILRSVMAIVITVIVSSFNSPDGLVPVVTASVLHALASHALATSLTTQTTGSVDKSEQGALLGLEHALFSLARIGGPALGTTLLAMGEGGFFPVAVACAGIDMALVALLVWISSSSQVASTERLSVKTDDHSD